MTMSASSVPIPSYRMSYSGTPLPNCYCALFIAYSFFLQRAAETLAVSDGAVPLLSLSLILMIAHIIGLIACSRLWDRPPLPYAHRACTNGIHLFSLFIINLCGLAAD
jgi:hypothetical protein